MKLQLKPFDEDQIEAIQNWFDDPQTQKWLGNKSWIDNVFRLQEEQLGTEFRGARKLAYYPFVAYDGDSAVGFIDGGISDRYVKYGGEVDGKPVYLETEDKPTSGISFVVNPLERGKGYATAMIKNLVQKPEYSDVQIFEAGVEPENIGSIKALEAAGFISDYKPDFEGMLYFLRRKDTA